MSDYGIQSTGFVRKPLSVILAEIEAAMITEFGPDVIQTSQSPFGQLNGLFADLTSEVWEILEDVYQSYDPDQAEGIRLDTLARLRLLNRSSSSDSDLRKAITNQGQARIDIQDLSNAISSIDGVTYSKVFVNDSGEIEDLEKGFVSLAVIGGDDTKIAETMRKYIVPGVNTYGNTRINSNLDGFCRSMSIIRPNSIDVSLTIRVKGTNDKFNCPAPSLVAVKDSYIKSWGINKLNGQNISFYGVRSIIESEFSNVEVISIQGSRDDIQYSINQDIPISFLEIANVSDTLVTVEFV